MGDLLSSDGNSSATPDDKPKKVARQRAHLQHQLFKEQESILDYANPHAMPASGVLTLNRDDIGLNQHNGSQVSNTLLSMTALK